MCAVTRYGSNTITPVLCNHVSHRSLSGNEIINMTQSAWRVLCAWYSAHQTTGRLYYDRVTVPGSANVT